MARGFRIALVAAAFCSTPALAAGFVDGGFEAQGADALGGQPFSYCYFNPESGAPDICSNADTPFGGNSGLIASGSGPWGGTASQAGGYHSFVQGGGTLTQTFTATGSGVYQLGWFDHQRTNNGGAQTYSVSLGTFVEDVPTFAAAAVPLEQGLGVFTASTAAWVARQSANFVLSAGTTYTLTFSGLTNTDNTAFIDTLAISAVPETSTWAMMILGLGMVGGALRRRAKPSVAVSFG